MVQDIILETRRLTKGFKGFAAVPDINLRVQRGSIHMLVGPSGAGRTACFNLLTKFLVPTRGTVLFNGVDVASKRPAQIVRRGIIHSSQISAMFPYLTTMEDVRVGLQWQLGTMYVFWCNKQSLDTLNARAMEPLEQAGLTEFAHTVTVELPYGHKRALEIAAALAMKPELTLLDELTQGMGHEDVDRVTELIKHVAQGRTILMVEHNMNVISSIADKITMLRRGQILTEGLCRDVSKNPQVMGAYIGTTDAALEGH